MRLSPWSLVIALSAACAAAENPCTNGSFETLDEKGFPVDWGAVGQTVEISDDAHSGKRSLRMARAAETETPETGLNRAWKPDSGEQGKMIGRLKGGIDFWYKAVSADRATLRVYAIPMNAEPKEGTGSQRATFTVPEHHVGDGEWHRAKLRYDFTDNEKVRWVHFAARIVGAAGELLLDDVAYVEKVGPLVRFGKARLDEDPRRPGRRCTFSVEVRSDGDEPAKDIVATLDLPEGLTAAPAEVRVASLPPDETAWAKWTVEGARAREMFLDLKVVAGDAEDSLLFFLQPFLTLESFGPTTPVAKVGERVAVECALRNDSNAVVLYPVAEFRLPAGVERVTAREVLPGRRIVLRTTFRPRHQTPALDLGVTVRAGDGTKEASLATSLVVGSAARLPRPAGRLSTTATDDLAVLENAHIRLAFRRNIFGFGPGELMARTRRGWRTVAWFPHLSRLVHRYAGGVRHESIILADAPPQELRDGLAGLRFSWQARDAEGAAWWVQCTFTLGHEDRNIKADYRLGCDQPRGLLAFDGPMLYALDRDEAVFPGLEWLVPGEVSSSTLDIDPHHPHRMRYVVHPNFVTFPAIAMRSRHGVVGLVWGAYQKWDGERDRLSVVFASPDRFRHCRAHVAGVFLPTVPDFVEPNAREATTPYPLEPERPLRLRCRLVADGLATHPFAPLDEWLRRHPLAEPTALPHKTYEGEVQFSMRGYLESLWEAETQEWWNSKGGNPLMCKLGRPRHYVADLLVGEILSPDEAVRKQCRQRAEEVLKLIGGEARVDAQRYGGRADLAYANPGRAAALLASMCEDGSWRFDADRRDQGVFKGRDYHELGPDEAVELGTCARNAYLVLNYARIAGDWDAYERMRKTLELMETFRVPRAAQVWEVPVHTPDILAAADAVDAYVEAYRFSGDERWLRDAVIWARRGLPFVYLWGDDEKPFLLGASIPVLGATWYRGSWFGRPVQWNGLRYANALLKLDETVPGIGLDVYARDKARPPWRHIAELIIRSAIHQQDLEGENAALWPDNINSWDSRKCPWVFAPRQIIRNVLKLAGRDEDPSTVILGKGRERLHVSAPARLSEATWGGRVLTFKAAFPTGQQGVVLVSNVARPTAVALDGKPIAERPEVEKGAEAGWRYDAANAYLSIRVPRDGATLVRVAGAAFRKVQRLPYKVERIAFEFDDSLEGWTPAHDIGEFLVRDGALVGTATGGDPYLIRGLMRVDAADCPVVVLRLRVSAGAGGQFFWTTLSSPSFEEAKSIRFPVQPDGQWHEIRLETGEHALWRGQTITALRIDPTSGVESADFAIDHVRGKERKRD